jgi:hypothetical protein
MKLPRSLFRCRRHRPPYEQPVIRAARKASLKPGTLTRARVWHEPDCPRPSGGPCTCKPHQIRVDLVPIKPEDPDRN